MDTEISKFNVTLPEGSMSQRIDDAIRPVTNLMNMTPLRINKATAMVNVKLAEVEATKLTQIVRELTGNPKMKPNSSADCVAALQAEGHEMSRKTKGGGTQCDKVVLEAIAAKGSKLAGAIIAAREAVTRLSQLIHWMPYAEAGSVQCVWDQNGTPMGRYTSDGPCLQNRIVPIRETIESDEGWSFLSLDLGQAEYVTWFALAGEPKSDVDVHTRMGKAILAANPDLDLRGESPRQFGKTINFAILYRMQAKTLAAKLGVPVEKAEKIIADYKAAAPKAAAYAEQILAAAHETETVSTKYGRVRRIPELSSSDWSTKNEAEKTAWHHHVCGTAAETLKGKTYKVAAKITEMGRQADAKMAMNMHDEIILMVRDEVLSDLRPVIEKVFNEAGSSWVTYSTTVKVGKTWKEISK